MAHESAHVEQSLRSGIHQYDRWGDWEDNRLRAELEAYAVQELFMQADVTLGHVLDGGVAETVNHLRRIMNADSKDKYFPDGRLRKALQERGLNVIDFMTDEERNAPFV